MSKLKKFSAFACALILVLAFQNCAKGYSSDGSSSEMMARIKQTFPTIASVQPVENVNLTSNTLTCSGSCQVMFTDNSMGGFGHIVCDGNLTVNAGQLVCDNNLTLSR